MITVAALGVTGLAGCSEDAGDTGPAPSGGDDISQPPAEQAPDMPVLEATLRRTRLLVEIASRANDEDASATIEAPRAALDTQARVLAEMVQAGGGERSQRDDTAQTGAPAASADTDSATATGPPPELEAAELAGLLIEDSSEDPISEELLTVSGINVPTLMALHGQRIAAARTLGADVTLPALRGPDGAGAITVLAGLRQAIYGLEVLAAWSAKDDREGYRDALASLRGPTRLVTELAGSAAPAPPLGYGLPSSLSTTRERRDAAQDLFVALSQSVIAGSSARAYDADAINGTIVLMALSVEVGTTFGVPMDGFPGLSLPEAISRGQLTDAGP